MQSVVRRGRMRRPTTSVVNRGENGRGMPLPYKNANNSIMYDVLLCLESVRRGPMCPPVMGRWCIDLGEWFKPLRHS